MIETRANTKIAMVLERLQRAETDLAEEFRKAGERHAVNHELYYGAQTLAKQCDARARRLAELATPYGKELDTSPDGEGGGLWESVVGAMRHTMAEAIGRQRVPGLLLLRDLRELYLHAMEANFYWVLAGQVAQAVRDHALLEGTLDMHEQLTTAVKWILTQTKVESPAILVVPD
jgi:hypothetical protein